MLKTRLHPEDAEETEFTMSCIKDPVKVLKELLLSPQVTHADDQIEVASSVRMSCPLFVQCCCLITAHANRQKACTTRRAACSWERRGRWRILHQQIFTTRNRRAGQAAQFCRSAWSFSISRFRDIQELPPFGLFVSSIAKLLVLVNSAKALSLFYLPI